MQRKAESSGRNTDQNFQAVKSQTLLLAQPQSEFADFRSEAAQLKAMQAYAAASAQPQALMATQAKMNGSPQVQRTQALQAHMASGRNSTRSGIPFVGQIENEELQNQTEEKPVQRESMATDVAPDPTSDAPDSNDGGLPNPLKAGIESLSGMNMDHVKVHYNSDKPLQLHAHAYAQGNDIHLASGQEQHLPHEAWHVVQQAQGRVKPTLQMKDKTLVNDDGGLETEADVMGAKAMDAGVVAMQGNTSPAACISPQTHSIPAPVHQLRVDPVLNPDIGAIPQNPTFLDCYLGSTVGLIVDINWVTPAQNIYEIIAIARPSLDDDEDVEYLQQLENRADDLVNQGNALIRTFNATAQFNRVFIGNQLNTLRGNVNNLLAEVQESFQITEGGFGAKGRATAINISIDRLPAEEDELVDNTYINNMSSNGSLLTNDFRVRKEPTAAIAGPQRLRVAGQDYNINGNGLNLIQRNTALGVLEGQLEAPQGDTDDSITAFASRNRGPGQEAGMSNTNARGYAWLTNTDGWNTTRWEWLHIRGASLGGATDSSNLVLGTRDSNTHMIPFESNLKALTTIVRDNPALYQSLNVTWDIDGQIEPHKFNTISISWSINRANGADADIVEPSGSMSFSPLDTGSVISKDEVEFLEWALRVTRDNIEREGEDDDDEDFIPVDEEDDTSDEDDVVDDRDDLLNGDDNMDV